ncbi:UNVERIFIED_CONTAM: Retrovirus-related Pol polyprotein from transposon RE1, partial [Sesamum latifolium]
VMSSRWVFTLKYQADGSIDRYKARLVANGFTQTYGVDYFETFSPVARLNSIRVLFSLAVNQDWPMYQMDVKNAFLYGDLSETVFMEQPPGYVAHGENQHMVCKLKKAIYGLKQSPRAWFDKFSKVINKFGFHRCQADHSVFVQ